MDPEPSLRGASGASALLGAVGPIEASLADALTPLGVALALQRAAALVGPSSVGFLKLSRGIVACSVRRL